MPAGRHDRASTRRARVASSIGSKHRGAPLLGGRLALAASMAALTMLVSVPASAGLFDDDEARKAILDLRSKSDANQRDIASQLELQRRNQADVTNQIDALRQDIARLRGQIESLTNDLDQRAEAQQGLLRRSRWSAAEGRAAAGDGRRPDGHRRPERGQVVRSGTGAIQDQRLQGIDRVVPVVPDAIPIVGLCAGCAVLDRHRLLRAARLQGRDRRAADGDSQLPDQSSSGRRAAQRREQSGGHGRQAGGARDAGVADREVSRRAGGDDGPRPAADAALRATAGSSATCVV